MARAVRIVMTDDLDGAEMDASEATTIRWSWCGEFYEFDTRAASVAAVERGDRPVTIADLLAVSRRAPHTADRESAGPMSPTAPAAIRAWARRHGHAVPSRGRIPTPIRMAYDLAQA